MHYALLVTLNCALVVGESLTVLIMHGDYVPISLPTAMAITSVNMILAQKGVDKVYNLDR